MFIFGSKIKKVHKVIIYICKEGRELDILYV